MLCWADKWAVVQGSPCEGLHVLQAWAVCSDAPGLCATLQSNAGRAAVPMAVIGGEISADCAPRDANYALFYDAATAPTWQVRPSRGRCRRRQSLLVLLLPRLAPASPGGPARGRRPVGGAQVVVPQAGHFQFLDEQSLLDRSVCAAGRLPDATVRAVTRVSLASIHRTTCCTLVPWHCTSSTSHPSTRRADQTQPHSMQRPNHRLQSATFPCGSRSLTPVCTNFTSSTCAVADMREGVCAVGGCAGGHGVVGGGAGTQASAAGGARPSAGWGAGEAPGAAATQLCAALHQQELRSGVIHAHIDPVFQPFEPFLPHCPEWLRGVVYHVHGRD